MYHDMNSDKELQEVFSPVNAMKMAHPNSVFFRELKEYNDTSKNKEECPDFLSSSQHKLLSGKPTLKSVLDKLDKVKHTSELQVSQCQNNNIVM